MVVGPDEYAALMLGEKEPPSNTRMLRLEGNSELSGRDAPVQGEGWIVSRGPTQDIPMTDEQSHAAAYLVFVKQSVANIERLGLENSVKIYSAGLELSESDALAHINTILDINEEHAQILTEMKNSNCRRFLQGISVAGERQAVSQFIADERGLHDATLSYFGGIDARLHANVPGRIYEGILEQVARIRGAVNMMNVDAPRRDDDSARSAADHYAVRCQQRLSGGN
jgi:hypothetical protein